MRLDITSMVCVLVLLRLHTPQREEEDRMEGLVLYNKVSKITNRNVCFIIVFDNIFGTTFYIVK